MTQDAMRALLAHYARDDGFRAVIDAASGFGEAIQIARDAGFDVSVADLEPVAERDLSDDELDASTGGTGNAFTLVVTRGLFRCTLEPSWCELVPSG